MRLETTFAPNGELITVEAIVAGPRGEVPARLVLDTGSSATSLVPDLLDEIGYSARDGHAITSVYSALGREHGYILRIAQFTALGFTFHDFPVHVFELAARYQIDGLVGLNFLNRFNYEIRSAEGRIIVEQL